MTLPEIDPRSGRPHGTYFRGREPWDAHFARSGNFPKRTGRGSNTPMGRWPGEFKPAARETRRASTEKASNSVNKYFKMIVGGI